MAKYVIEESSLTGIADEIRTMSGSTEKITPSEMVTNLQTLNAEIENQAELISQIQVALESKASGNSGVSSGTGSSGGTN